jgi:hypothetical protein
MRKNDRKIMLCSSFSTWFKDKWTQSGGLISPSIAAKILGISMPRINQIWKDRGLEKYIYDDEKKPLLGLFDVMQIEDERTEKVINDENVLIEAGDHETGYILKISCLNDVDSIQWNNEELKKVVSLLSSELEHTKEMIRENEFNRPSKNTKKAQQEIIEISQEDKEEFEKATDELLKILKNKETKKDQEKDKLA